LASKEQKVKELLDRIKQLNAKQANIEERMKKVEKALSSKEPEE
jgi:hypothetical protein